MRVEEAHGLCGLYRLFRGGNEGRDARGNFDYGIVTMTARRENVRWT